MAQFEKELTVMYPYANLHDVVRTGTWIDVCPNNGECIYLQRKAEGLDVLAKSVYTSRALRYAEWIDFDNNLRRVCSYYVCSAKHCRLAYTAEEANYVNTFLDAKEPARITLSEVISKETDDLFGF